MTVAGYQHAQTESKIPPFSGSKVSFFYNSTKDERNKPCSTKTVSRKCRFESIPGTPRMFDAIETRDRRLGVRLFGQLVEKVDLHAHIDSVVSRRRHSRGIWSS